MRKKIPSQNQILLLELLLNIMLFLGLLVISLQFFIKAHTLTEDTVLLHHAVTECNNVATLYKESDGSLATINSIYSNSTSSPNVTKIYYDTNFQPCTKITKVYELRISIKEEGKAKISFFRNEDKVYTLTASAASHLTPADKEAKQ